MERQPAVAGSFYPASSEGLKKQIEECFLHPLGPGELPHPNPKTSGNVIGVVSPHAGYVYSGAVASFSYLELANDRTPETFVIIGPNHTGFGESVSIDTEKVWRTPLGMAKVDLKLSEEILKEAPFLKVDESAHAMEHSIEVQLPFLHYVYGSEIKFLPIAMLDQSYETSKDLGKALAKILGRRQAVIIASTDMTHYEPREEAKKKDSQALEHICKLDEEGLVKTVESLGISMCGVGPVTSMLIAAKELGATAARLLSYQTSGDITGDYLGVVGYASVVAESGKK